jgi:hypothetical protein
MGNTIKNKPPAGKTGKVKKAGMRIESQEYLKLAELCKTKARTYKNLSSQNAYYNQLAEKCKAKAAQLAKVKPSTGPSKQKKKAERWKCKACKEKFDKPVNKRHCPTCDATDIEQLKLTAFTTTAKPDLEPGESNTEEPIAGDELEAGVITV